MRKTSYLVGATAGVLAAGLLFDTATAQEPEPNTFVDVPVPQLTRWSNVNARSVDPQSPDGRTYIYPDQATRDADTAEDGTGSVALIHWELDDGSGLAPGIQTVTDDFAFYTHNCIMASGEREREGATVPKTCSDPPGSSKRVFLEIHEVDTPIDIVFETGVKDIRYKGVQDPALAGNDDALSAFRDTYGIGRIYRVIQKFINDTDERLAAIRVEVGTGVGNDFTPLAFEDYGVAFELRELVEREFFVGETGAGDREVWDANRFAHFSPKMFDDGARPRFDPGFLDVQPAGLFPPQAFQTTVAGGTKSQYIDSGDALNASGHYGAITSNYFDLPGNQGSDAGIPGNVFGYMMPDNVVPTVVERHDDGNPDTESDGIEAWWDGSTWRYGVADGFAEVPVDQLEQWAAQLLGLDLPDVSDTTRYDTGPSDDVSGFNMDTYLYLGDDLLEAGDNSHFNNGSPKHDSITVRYTAIPASHLGSVPGTEDPEWTKPGQEAPALNSYMPDTGVPVAINDSAMIERDEVADIEVIANDLLDGAPLEPDPTVEVTVEDDPANGTATVEDDNSVTYSPTSGFTGEDSFTYRVTVDGEESNLATVKVEVVEPPDPDKPVARNDSATPTGTESVTIDILANDTVGPLEEPVDPAEATVNLGSQPEYGSVELNSDNTVTYQADADPTSPVLDYVTYTVTVEGEESNPALIIVRVDPTVVVPTVPVAVDDTATTIETDPVTIDVLANDTQDGIAVPDDATVQIVDQPSNGSVEVDANQMVTYTADEGFTGEDTFTYLVDVDGEVSDPATVNVTVEQGESGGGGSGCSIGTSGESAPLLPFLALLVVLGLGLRRLTRSSR
ncbi:MAG: choice-of-anchor F family protein [Myxococcota bacterium]